MKLKSKISISTIFIINVIFLFLQLICQYKALARTVTLETIQAGIQISSSGPQTIAIDTKKQVHIVYGGNFLYHATFDGINWSVEIVDSTYGTGEFASIAIDSSDNIHIAYNDQIQDDLKYATNKSGVWIIETIDSAGDVGRSISIALSSDNSPHISYFYKSDLAGSETQDLKYATNSSGSWVTETVDFGGDVGEYSSIILDSDNAVHISYFDSLNNDIKYATNSSGSWVTEIAASDAETFAVSSIALDSSDQVYISYEKSGNDLGLTTRKTTGIWENDTIDDSCTTGNNSLFIDPSDTLHISYSCTKGLRYAENSSGSWNI